MGALYRMHFTARSGSALLPMDGPKMRAEFGLCWLWRPKQRRQRTSQGTSHSDIKDSA